MTSRAGVIVVTLALTGCGIGSDGGDDTHPSPDGPKSHILCTSAIHSAGSFVQGQTRPIDPTTGMPMTGCWPDGTWTFTASVQADSTQQTPQCAPPSFTAPTFQSNYVFTDNRTANDTGELTVDNFTYPADPSGHWTIKISESGNGYCDADFEIYSADGKSVWNLHPSLDSTTNMLNGGGDFTLYDVDQWQNPGP